jgi:TonB family protein
MSKRFWILSVCIAVHAAALVAMYASNVWGIERLDGGKQLAGIAVLSPPAPSGGPEGLPETKMNKKKPKEQPKKIVDVPVQPVVPKEEDKKVEPLVGDGGGGGNTTGPGTNPDGKPDDTGTCTGPLCGAGSGEVVEKPKKKKVTFVAPPDMQHLRVWGDPKIHPAANTKTEILRDGKNKVTGVIQLCISETGAITSVTINRSTGYPAYDQRLIDGARTWRYRPHILQGEAVPACSFISFVYTIM